jgi:hypothetical protein
LLPLPLAGEGGGGGSRSESVPWNCPLPDPPPQAGEGTKTESIVGGRVLRFCAPMLGPAGAAAPGELKADLFIDPQWRIDASMSPHGLLRGDRPGWLCHAARRVGSLPVAKFYRSMSAVAEGLVA